MLIYWNKDSSRVAVAIGGEMAIENAETHIKLGHPAFLNDWNEGRLAPHIMEDAPTYDVKFITMVNSIPTIVKEQAERDAIIANIEALKAEEKAIEAAEAKITDEIRIMAIESLYKKGETLPVKISDEVVEAKITQ